MWLVWLVGLGPLLLALLGAVGVRFLTRESSPPLEGRVATATALAGAVPALVVAVLAVLWNWSLIAPASFVVPRVRYLVPLVLGVLAALALMVPGRRPRTRATAEVARRTVTSVLAVRDIVAVAALVVVVIVLSLVAGAASEPDEEGRQLRFTMPAGTGSTVSTTIYGWYFSLPALAVVAVLLATAVIAWTSVARPPWGDDVASDTAVRRARCANITRVTCGALLVHLSYVLQSLHATVSLSAGVNTTEIGMVFFHTPLAVLAPVLQGAGLLALAGGLMLWLVTSLTALPVGARHGTVARS